MRSTDDSQTLALFGADEIPPPPPVPLPGACSFGPWIEFVVHGDAKPQGSLQSFYVAKLGRTVTPQKQSVIDWRTRLADAGAQVVLARGGELLDGPVQIQAVIYSLKPKSWPRWRVLPSTRPDWDKLARAIGDALSGVVYRDDALIVDAHVAKRCGEPARCEVRVREIRER